MSLIKLFRYGSRYMANADRDQQCMRSLSNIAVCLVAALLMGSEHLSAVVCKRMMTLW